MRVPLLDLAASHRELKAELAHAIAAVVESGGFIGGAEVQAFEAEFAAYLGAAHAVGVANGTDALELALQAAGVGPGDVVLTVPFTFAATLEAIVRVGAQPAFVDLRDDDYTMDVDAAAERFARGPVKALIPVHLYGHPANLDRLVPLAHAQGAVVIEDAAQAHGAWCPVGGARRRAGAVGDLGCFSFYPTKNLGAMGDAGAVVTNDPALAGRVRLLANHGEAAKYQHTIANGRNSRLDAVQAAILRVKLRRLDAWNAARRMAATRYGERLCALPVRLPIEQPGYEAVYHQYVIRVAARDAVRAALAARGIATAVHYPLALHEQPGFRGLDFGAPRFPIAEQCARDVLSLPLHPHLTTEQIEAVVQALHDCVERAA
jgi:dTDP-4-amino-4,6-dideoxygalactose transaminase